MDSNSPLPVGLNRWAVPRDVWTYGRQTPEPAAQIVNANESLAAVFRGDEIAVLDRLVKRGSTDPRSGARLGDCQSKLFQDCLAIVGRFDSGGQAHVRAGDGKSI